MSAQPITIKVDALTDVLDIRKGKLMTEQLSSHAVENGKTYEVTVKSNAFYGGSNSLPVNKVAIYNTSNNDSNGWFYVVEEGNPITITMGETGTESNKVYAFFIDITSQDNVGSAEVSFQPI